MSNKNIIMKKGFLKHAFEKRRVFFGSDDKLNSSERFAGNSKKKIKKEMILKNEFRERGKNQIGRRSSKND